MDADRYQQVKTILADVLERPAHERAGLLTARCGEDADLRGEIESLLAYESGDDFLVPPAELAALRTPRGR
jgi:eukaryotic-like serine/threonine-protein kinase